MEREKRSVEREMKAKTKNPKRKAEAEMSAIPLKRQTKENTTGSQ